MLACGAIAREVLAVIRLNGWSNVTVRCLPAKLHSRPELIAPAVDAKLHELGGRYERVFVAYADCGTGGELDRVLERHGVERLAGRPLLRVPHRERRVGGAPRRRAGDLLSHRLPRAALRRDRDPRPRARPPSGAPRRSTSATTGGCSISRRPTTTTCVAAHAPRPSGSASRTRSGAPATATSLPSLPASWRRRPLPELTVIWWRDIPAQVTAKEGRRSARAQLRSASRRRSTPLRCARA